MANIDQYVMEINRKTRNAYEKKHRELRQRQKRAVDTILYATHILLDWSGDEPCKQHVSFWDFMLGDAQWQRVQLERLDYALRRGSGEPRDAANGWRLFKIWLILLLRIVT